MNANMSKILSVIMAAATCLGYLSQVNAFWTEVGREQGIFEQMGISSDLKDIEMPRHEFVNFTAPAPNEQPWAFFDLGKTLISHTPQYTDMKYIPGARNYLKDLKSRGLHLGMLINWPEDEGSNNAEKLELLKQFLSNGWSEPFPFDWDIFEAVLFPPKNVFRKPHPYLFRQALNIAAFAGAVYQCENAQEVAEAERAGLPTHRVVFFPEPGEKPIPYLSADEIMKMACGDGCSRQDWK